MELTNNLLTVIVNTEPVKFIQAVNNYYSALTENTKKTYTAAIQDFLKFKNIGINEIITINKADIIRYAEHLATQYRNATLNLKITALRNLFNELEKVINGFTSPFNNLSKAEKNLLNRPTEKKIKREAVLTEPEINAILTHLCERYKQNKRLIYFRNHIIFSLLIKSGLRISELINAKKNDVLNISGTYYLRIIGKGNKERSIIIPDNIYKMLCDYNSKINNQSEYLIIKENGGLLNRRELHLFIQRIGAKILNKKFSPHTLRHSFATIQLIEKKKSLTAVSQYLGHSSTAITANLYIHDCLNKNDIDALGGIMEIAD